MRPEGSNSGVDLSSFSERITNRRKSVKSSFRSFILLLTVLIYSNFQETQAQSSFQHFRGSFHSHSYYSDGNMANQAGYFRAKPCFEYADRSAQIDFWGISDHNHSQAGMNLPDWHKGLLEADSVNQPGSYVTMYGMEYGIISSGGHVIIYGIDSLIGWETGNFDLYNSEYDYNSLFYLIKSRPSSFAYLAHMSYDDYNNLLGQSYKADWDSAIVGMAVKSGPAFSTDTTYTDPSPGTYFNRFKDMLAKGYHLSPGIDHDSHYINFGRSHQGRTVILADTLTRTALMQSIRAGQFYASDDYNLKLDFKVNGNIMGSIVNGSSDPVININVTDPDNELTSEIRLYYGVSGNNLQPVIIASVYNSSTLTYTHIIPANTSNYYFTEIIQADGQRTYSAPVWYTRNGQPSPVELLHFNGELQNGNAVLNWSTASEQNADRFDIKKNYLNQPSVKIGTVQANGFTNTLSQYSYTDPEKLISTTQYQLQIFNMNGDFSYSGIVTLSPLHKDESIVLFPNPGSGNELWTIIKSDSLQHLQLQVINAAGQIMMQTEFFTSEEKTVLQIPADNLRSGLYLVSVTNMDTREHHTERLIRN